MKTIIIILITVICMSSCSVTHKSNTGKKTCLFNDLSKRR